MCRQPVCTGGKQHTAQLLMSRNNWAQWWWCCLSHLSYRGHWNAQVLCSGLLPIHISVSRPISYHSVKMSILSLASTGTGEVSFTPLALKLETGVKRMECGEVARLCQVAPGHRQALPSLIYMHKWTLWISSGADGKLEIIDLADLSPMCSWRLKTQAGWGRWGHFMGADHGKQRCSAWKNNFKQNYGICHMMYSLPLISHVSFFAITLIFCRPELFITVTPAMTLNSPFMPLILNICV